VADADFVASATLVAVIVTLPAVAGAVYVELNVPDDGLLFPENEPPFVAIQVTPALAASLVTVAVNCRACEVATPPRLGLTVTVIFGGGMLDDPDEHPCKDSSRVSIKK